MRRSRNLFDAIYFDIELSEVRLTGSQARRVVTENAQGAPMQTILAQWRRERPDLDSSPMEVCGEIWRAGERIRQGVVDNLVGKGLDYPGFDVILTLRRQGRDGSLSPSGLAQEMMLSSSAMTSRLDRLEKRGLIARLADPADRRALRIVLTDAGFALADELVASHVAMEARMLGGLSADERNLLAILLRKIGQAT